MEWHQLLPGSSGHLSALSHCWAFWISAKTPKSTWLRHKSCLGERGKDQSGSEELRLCTRKSQVVFSLSLFPPGAFNPDVLSVSAGIPSFSSNEVDLLLILNPKERELGTWYFVQELWPFGRDFCFVRALACKCELELLLWDIPRPKSML